MEKIDTFKVRGINVANIYNQSGMAFFGIAVLAGSNYETPEVAGVSHYAEHGFFKNTPTRNWRQINEEFARLGISNNAYTSNTEVVYHATCPKENLEKTITLMTDLFFNSTFPADELEKERTVIVEEKKMYDDDPRSAFSLAANNHLFSWNVGHDTIGTFDTINSISREQIIKYLNDKTNLDNFVFVCAGDIDSKDLASFIEKNIPEKHEYLKQGNGLHTLDLNNVWNKSVLEDTNKIKFLMERENITQSNASMVFNALPNGDPMFYAQSVLYTALGGGMFSKLFARIREELGLCYRVGMTSYPLSYPNFNISDLYGYTSPENVDKFMLESEKILKDVMVNGLDENIFNCAKTDYLADVLRAVETSEGKARNILKKILIYKTASIEESIAKIRNVTREDCNDLAKKVFDTQFHWIVMNPKV